MAKLFYTLEEAAQKLRKSTDEVMSMARAGQLVELRDKDQVLFRRSAIDQLAGDADMGSDINLDGLDLSSGGGSSVQRQEGGGRMTLPRSPGIHSALSIITGFWLSECKL